MKKVKKMSSMTRFLVLFLLLFGAWELLYTFWLEKDGTIDFYLTSMVADSSVFLLKSIGYDINSIAGAGQCRVLYHQGERLLLIAHPCNGLVLQVLFVVFLICFKGDVIIKLITIVFGCLGIYFINVLRVSGLVLIQIYYPEYLDFSHKWLFTIIVYSFVFTLWMLWVNRLSKVSILSK